MIMLYAIKVRLNDNSKKVYYSNNFKEAYEMFRRMGKRLIKTSLFIKSKMYEKLEGSLRKGVFYGWCGEEATEVGIDMFPCSGIPQEERFYTPEEALEDLHWIIFQKELNKATKNEVQGVNDYKIHYGNKYKY